MNANAPEKIYIGVVPSDLGNNRYTTVGKDFPDAEEYAHVDAFIEKACSFLEENIEEEDCKIGSSEWTELRAEYKSLDSFIRAFREYMKG